MKRLTSLFLFLFIGNLLLGCRVLNSEEDNEGIFLRITNSSQIEFHTVYVSFPGAEATFETISAGETTNYQELETAYRYGFIRVESGEETYVLQPIDYVGENPLKSGKYTFRIDIYGESLTFNVIKD